jgi:DNA mismatch repair ATPase MutS
LARLEASSQLQSAQRDLFSPDRDAVAESNVRLEHPLFDELRDAKPDEMSPRDALALVYKLKSALGDESE